MTTNPLTKSILTGEGILAYAVNVALVVAASLPNTLSWTHAAIFITIVTVLQVISRTLLKVKAIQAGFGQDVPTVDPVDPAEIKSDLESILAILEAKGLADPAPAAPTP